MAISYNEMIILTTQSVNRQREKLVPISCLAYFGWMNAIKLNEIITKIEFQNHPLYL